MTCAIAKCTRDSTHPVRLLDGSVLLVCPECGGRIRAIVDHVRRAEATAAQEVSHG